MSGVRAFVCDERSKAVCGYSLLKLCDDSCGEIVHAGVCVCVCVCVCRLLQHIMHLRDASESQIFIFTVISKKQYTKICVR